MKGKKAKSHIPTSTFHGRAGRKQRQIKTGQGKSLISQDQLEILRNHSESLAEVFA